MIFSDCSNWKCKQNFGFTCTHIHTHTHTHCMQYTFRWPIWWWVATTERKKKVNYLYNLYKSMASAGLKALLQHSVNCLLRHSTVAIFQESGEPGLFQPDRWDLEEVWRGGAIESALGQKWCFWCKLEITADHPQVIWGTRKYQMWHT